MKDALSFVRFSELQNWSVLYLTTKAIGYNRNYTLFSIGSFLHRSDDSIVIMDEEEYIQVTVHTNNGGIEARDLTPKLGKDIGTKRQYRIHEGQFLMSKIDARNGAFGIVPSDLGNAIVTQDFPVFNVDNSKLNSEYLLLVTTTEHFKKVAQDCSSGTTNRQRIDIKKFLAQRVPLPSKSQQDDIVARYNQTIAEAEAKETEAEQLESEIEQYLMGELGTSVLKSAFKNRINFVRFADTERWDVPYFISSTKAKSKYETVSITNCLDHFMEDMNGKAIRIETAKFPDSNFHYLGMENVEKNTGELIDLPVVKGSEIKSQTILIPQDFLIYGKLRPYLNKYWLNETQLTDIVCSSEFFVFHVKPSINTLYFKYVLASSFVQQQLSDQSSGARMPRINEKIFNNIQIPIPPIDVQKEIVDHISEMKARIKLLKQEAATLRDKALKDFENEIFE